MNMRMAFRKKRVKKIKPTEEKSSMGFISVRDLELHAAVDDIALQPVQTDDLLVAVTVTEILLCDCPEGISVRYGMNAIVLGRL